MSNKKLLSLSAALAALGASSASQAITTDSPKAVNSDQVSTAGTVSAFSDAQSVITTSNGNEYLFSLRKDDQGRLFAQHRSHSSHSSHRSHYSSR